MYPPLPQHNRTGPRGFTLIELLVAMTIIAIGFFALRPNFVRSIQGNRDRAALRRVVGVLTAARTEAVARGRLVRVVVVPGRGEMWGEFQSLPEEDKSQFDVLPLMGRSHIVLPDYVALTDLIVGGESSAQREGLIYFYPDGRTSGASLTLLGGAGGEYPVDLSPTTGRVRIAE